MQLSFALPFVWLTYLQREKDTPIMSKLIPAYLQDGVTLSHSVYLLVFTQKGSRIQSDLSKQIAAAQMIIWTPRPIRSSHSPVPQICPVSRHADRNGQTEILEETLSKIDLMGTDWPPTASSLCASCIYRPFRLHQSNAEHTVDYTWQLVYIWPWVPKRATFIPLLEYCLTRGLLPVCVNVTNVHTNLHNLDPSAIPRMMQEGSSILGFTGVCKAYKKTDSTEHWINALKYSRPSFWLVRNT